jgi:hypothetical protein
MLAAAFGHWQWKGDFTILDLIAASTSALNGKSGFVW